MVQTFAFDQLPSEPRTWPSYRKKVETRAIKIEGPFMVETSEGPLNCADGYLAVDARGYPYPIATEEFALIYEPIKDEPLPEQITGA